MTAPYLPQRWLLSQPPSASLYSAADYAAALTALKPRGRAWPTDPSSVQQQVIAALAPTAQRLDDAAQRLLPDVFPASSTDFLGEWEETLGLVRSDAGATNAVRQAAIVGRLTEVGGQSKADFISYAASLGATITIATYAPFRCGLNGCGDQVGGEDWCFAWSITVLGNTGALTSVQLLAAIQALAPAETEVFLAS